MLDIDNHPGGQDVTDSAPGVQQNTSKPNGAREYRLDPTRSCFLDLPAEIRNEIYRWALLVAPTGPPPNSPQMKRLSAPMFARFSDHASRKIREAEAKVAKQILEMTESDYVHFTGSMHCAPCPVAQWKPVGTGDSLVLVKPIEGGGLAPGLLAVNKRVNAEAAPFLYARNKFKAEDSVLRINALQRFVDIIGVRNATYINHVRLVGIADCSLPRGVDLSQPEWTQWIQKNYRPNLNRGIFPLDKTLLAMTGLKMVEFKLTRHWFGDHVDIDGAAMKIFGLIRDWLETVAAKEGRSNVLERIKLFTWHTARIMEIERSEELRSFLERTMVTRPLSSNA